VRSSTPKSCCRTRAPLGDRRKQNWDRLARGHERALNWPSDAPYPQRLFTGSKIRLPPLNTVSIQQVEDGSEMPIPSSGSSTTPVSVERRMAPRWTTYQTPRHEIREAMPNEWVTPPCS